MDEATFKVLRMMKEELGELGPLIFMREVRSLGPGPVSSLDDSQKEALVDNLVESAFSDRSAARKRLIRSKLRSKLIFSREARKGFDERAALSYLLGRPN